MKILLVDDHNLFRAGLRLLIQTVQPGTIILESAGIEDALCAAKEHPDLRLCFLDIHLSNENGLDALDRLKAHAPEIAIVVVSADDHYQAIAKSLDAGAMGYIPKRSTSQQLSMALSKVLNGEIYLPDGITGEREKNLVAVPALSKRQWEVFHCLMRGLPNKLVCRELSLSDNTVKSHLGAIYRAFEVHTRTQLMFIASKMTGIPGPATLESQKDGGR